MCFLYLCSSHPYIFFNGDNESITFLGFMVTKNGDLVDPAQGAVLEQAIMKPQLYTGLKQNRVNFDEDYRHWRKDQMITKIASVMGLKFVYDPDETYVLTTDNLIKMLAIQMRFRLVSVAFWLGGVVNCELHTLGNALLAICIYICNVM